MFLLHLQLCVCLHITVVVAVNGRDVSANCCLLKFGNCNTAHLQRFKREFVCVFLTCGLCVCLSAAWICCSRNSVWLWRIACSSSTCCVITFRRSGCSWVSRDRTCTQTWCTCVDYFKNRSSTVLKAAQNITKASELLPKYSNSNAFYIIITTRMIPAEITERNATIEQQQLKVNNKMDCVLLKRQKTKHGKYLHPASPLLSTFINSQPV